MLRIIAWYRIFFCLMQRTSCPKTWCAILMYSFFFFHPDNDILEGIYGKTYFWRKNIESINPNDDMTNFRLIQLIFMNSFLYLVLLQQERWNEARKPVLHWQLESINIICDPISVHQRDVIVENSSAIVTQISNSSQIMTFGYICLLRIWEIWPFNASCFNLSCKSPTYFKSSNQVNFDKNWQFHLLLSFFSCKYFCFCPLFV